MIWTFALTVLLQVPPPSQELAPGTTYDPAIPTLEQVVGHDFREEITPPDAIVHYLEALQAEAPEQPIDYLKAIEPVNEGPEYVPGAILRGVLDSEHWLAAGTDGEIGVFYASASVFSPITLDRGTNVGRYAPLEALVMGGVVWEEARPQLANKPFLIHQPVGRGQIVAFAEDPNYRAYTESTMLLFMNAVLLGPGG